MRRRFRKFAAKVFQSSDDTTNSTQSEDPASRSPAVRLPTPLLQEQPVFSPPTTLPVQLPTPLLQLSIPMPAASQPAAPVPPSPTPTPALPDPVLPIPTLSTSPPAILSPTPSSSTLALHFRGNGAFNRAHDFTLYYPQFNDSSPAGLGLKHLFDYSMPDAFYNSSARYPPPKCHLGTRNDYIDLITKWAVGESDRQESILWMRGPFGVGKTAIAQSCAEALAPTNKLAATLFFSRSNVDRDDPRRVFTSIAYQVATKCPPFREIVDKLIVEDPALTTTSPPVQFENLLVHPLRQVGTAGSSLHGHIVIIDGLDECRGTAEQCKIIKIIAASARNCTTPFRWFITSRPEDPIIRTMNSTTVAPFCSGIELPISRDIDHKVLLYLTDEFKKIREDHGLPGSWPPEEAVALLVERGAGLWIYVSTMVRFIKDENSYGPKDQLRIVVEFARDVSARVGVDNPLAEMDFFYILIIQRVPPKVRTTVRKVLLIHSTLGWSPARIASILCLSDEQLHRACASIQSVMELLGPDLEHMTIKFYHTSFLDFMRDPQRSKELCIHSDFLIGWRRELLEWLHKVWSRSTDSSHIVFPSCTVLPEHVSRLDHHEYVLCLFWLLCGVPEHPFDPQAAMSLAELPFGKMLRLTGYSGMWLVDASSVRNNLSVEFRDKIIRNAKCPIPGCTNTENIWILGHGANEIVSNQSEGGFCLGGNRNPPEGECFCGAQKVRGSQFMMRGGEAMSGIVT
ncbi:hypothetical protein D9756_010653 [Leucocoprinus leucothites]|uniref:Nephrocystin 3-like N-terminal domain-containing protein n=1 Tax=Leucocoprinus leucothites TaxID=201217 RepID=A0A8H5CT70_9AGAR|nr:hypothetical protein D9756_010653 [Leucoagaricus leucothites]